MDEIERDRYLRSYKFQQDLVQGIAELEDREVPDQTSLKPGELWPFRWVMTHRRPNGTEEVVLAVS